MRLVLGTARTSGLHEHCYAGPDASLDLIPISLRFTSLSKVSFCMLSSRNVSTLLTKPVAESQEANLDLNAERQIADEVKAEAQRDASSTLTPSAATIAPFSSTLDLPMSTNPSRTWAFQLLSTAILLTLIGQSQDRSESDSQPSTAQARQLDPSLLSPSAILSWADSTIYQQASEAVDKLEDCISLALVVPLALVQVTMRTVCFYSKSCGTFRLV